MLHQFEPYDDNVSALAFSHDNEVLASGSNDQNIILWNVTSGQEIRRLEPHVAVHSLAFSPDGSKLVAGAYDGSLFVWNTATYEDPVKLSRHVAAVTFAVFSPDGRYMATGGLESECYIWDMARLKLKLVLRGHKGMVYDLYSVDPQLSLDGHDSMIGVVEFSPDGNYIASAALDSTMWLWKAEDGSALTTYKDHSNNVTVVVFSPDSSTLASGSHDGTVCIQPLHMPTAG